MGSDPPYDYSPVTSPSEGSDSMDIRAFIGKLRLTATPPPSENDMPETSRGSITAASGHTAEGLLCTQASVRTAFSVYFDQEVTAIEKIPSRPHPKKSDLRIRFADGSSVTVQNKNGGWGGRGYSVDRRPVQDVAPTCPALTETLRTVCLHEEGSRLSIEKEVGLDVIRRCILGTEASTQPDYFLHSTLADGQISSMAIVRTDVFMNRIVSDVYDTAVSKQTCVHISPHIYLQRKGGGSADTRPNDIQMKLRITPAVAEVFTPLTLESRPQAPVQTSEEP
jgi:hypothetical protein